MRRFGKKLMKESKYDVIGLEFSDVTSQGGMLSYSFLDSDNEDDFVPFNVNVYINGNKIEDIAFYDFIKDEILDIPQAAEEFNLDDKELNKIIQDAREEAKEYLMHRAVKESRRLRGRMLREGIDIDIPENDPSVEEEDRIRREKAHEDKIKKLANSVIDFLKKNDSVEITAWTERWVGRNYVEDVLEVADLFKKKGYYCYIRDPYSHHHVREIIISKTRLPSSYGEML